jgi:phosphatidylglycerol:prolipoprotein diacylglycerol transferase
MALPFPDIPPQVFEIPRFTMGSVGLGPFAIRWYALAYIAGILLGWRYAVSLTRDAKIWGGGRPTATALQIDDLVLWITLGIIAGGRLGYIAFYMLPLASGRETLAADPVEAIRLWHGGMSFHGGAIGVTIALVLFARSQKLDVLRLGDLVAPVVPIGLGFGRIANFINGELWGRVTTVPWGMVFCGRHIPTDAYGRCVAGLAPRHPSQLYEATLEGLVLFLILRLATHGLGWLRRPGAITGLFLAAYGLFRIALERVRMPDAGLQDLPLGLTVGTLLSVPMVLIGAWLIWRAMRRPPMLAEPPSPAADAAAGAAHEPA